MKIHPQAVEEPQYICESADECRDNLLLQRPSVRKKERFDEPPSEQHYLLVERELERDEDGMLWA